MVSVLSLTSYQNIKNMAATSENKRPLSLLSSFLKTNSCRYIKIYRNIKTAFWVCVSLLISHLTSTSCSNTCLFSFSCRFVFFTLSPKKNCDSFVNRTTRVLSNNFSDIQLKLLWSPAVICSVSFFFFSASRLDVRTSLFKCKVKVSINGCWNANVDRGRERGREGEFVQYHQ